MNKVTKSRKHLYIVVGPIVDGERLYWSNTMGWVDRASATRFRGDENISYPMEATGREELTA